VCKLCESDVKRTDKCFKCLFCYNKYHVKCLKYDEADIKVLSKFNNFKFVCDDYNRGVLLMLYVILLTN
jgi:hypothetical protein